LKIVQRSLGVTVAHSVAGKALLGSLALMGTSAEVDIDVPGSLPVGCTGLTGQFKESNVRDSKDVVGAAKAEAMKEATMAEVFIMRCDVRN
jgi:hypothetical protein